MTKNDFIIRWYKFLLHPTPSAKINNSLLSDQYRTRILERYFVKYQLPQIKDFPIIESPSYDSSQEREFVFSMWFQGEENAPKLVKSCFNSIRQHCSEYNVVILDEKTLYEYISIPENIIYKFKHGTIGPAHFSDICRIQLLRKYGGFWIDATDFVTAPIPQFIVDSNYFMYSNPHSYMFVNTCFMRAKKGNPLINVLGELLLNYWNNQDRILDYFMLQSFFHALTNHNNICHKEYEKMPIIDHLPLHELWYYQINEPYCQATIDNLNAKGYFFQKTSHHKAMDIVPNSFADYIVNGTK